MAESLLNAVRRYAQTHADGPGLAQSPVPGLTIIRSTKIGGLVHAVSRPLVCLVLQGSKRVVTGAQSLTFEAGDSLLITADVPTVNQITRASIDTPYLSLVLDLDAAVLAELTAQIKTAPPDGGAARVRADRTDAEVADAALRLMRLLERPNALPILRAPVVRELHYWVLTGRHGASIQALGWPGGHTQRVARAVTILRAEFAEPLSIPHHFRRVTSLSPLQFQKHLRLIEGRRLMLSEEASPSEAALAVGYESISQFTREYRRMFSLPPARETKAARRSLTSSHQGVSGRLALQEKA